MKKHLMISVFCCFLVSQPLFAESPSWKLESDTIWAREEGKATMSRKGGEYLIAHTGTKDWSVTLHPNIPVTPGDAFRISFKIQNEGPGSAGFTVGMFDGEKKIIDWNQGKAVQGGPCAVKAMTDEFVIPWGGASILPRITGHGVTKVRCFDFKLEKLEKVVLLDPVREVPAAGKEPLNLLPRETAFSKSVFFKGDTPFVQTRGRIPRS